MTTTIDKDGCLIVNKTNRQMFGNIRQLIVVPQSMVPGLLHSLHINLNHPTKDQLLKLVTTRFHILNIARQCEKVIEACTICTSMKSIPREIHEFKSNIVPDHPRKSFTVNVIREAGKFILAAVCNFSGYLTTTIIPSEKSSDLCDGIVTTVSPFMSSSLSKIRVDMAPGFSKLSKEQETLSCLGIELDLGDEKNKNPCAVVDERIRELRKA